MFNFIIFTCNYIIYVDAPFALIDAKHIELPAYETYYINTFGLFLFTVLLLGFNV